MDGHVCAPPPNVVYTRQGRHCAAVCDFHLNGVFPPHVGVEVRRARCIGRGPFVVTQSGGVGEWCGQRRIRRVEQLEAEVQGVRLDVHSGILSVVHSTVHADVLVDQVDNHADVRWRVAREVDTRINNFRRASVAHCEVKVVETDNVWGEARPHPCGIGEPRDG